MADYPAITTLSALDTAVPADTETVANLPAADRQLRDFLATFLAIAFDDDGTLKSSAVSAAAIAADSIDGTKIADDAIDSEHIAAGAIAAEHMGASSVATAAIEDAAVTEAKMGTGAVVSDAIGAAAVITAKIADNAVDANKLKSDATSANRAVTSTHIQDGAVTEDRIGTKAVSAGKMKSAGTAALIFVTKADGSVIEASVGGALAATLNGTVLELDSASAGDVATYASAAVKPGSGGTGGTSVACSAGVWTTKNIRGNWSEVSDGGSLISVSGTQITIALAGTYVVRAWAAAYSAGLHRVKIRNTTDGTDLLLGSSALAGAGQMTLSQVQGAIQTTDVNKVIELWHWTEKAVTDNGLGVPVGTGDDECYAFIELLKV